MESLGKENGLMVVAERIKAGGSFILRLVHISLPLNSSKEINESRQALIDGIRASSANSAEVEPTEQSYAA